MYYPSSIIMFEVTLIPLLVAAIVAVILGFIWFHTKVFGAAYMRCVNLTPEQQAKGRKRMPVAVFFAFASSLLAAYVLNYFGIAWGVYDWVGAIELGIWVWLGFAAPPLLGMILWEMRPIKQYAIVGGYWLVNFIVMALVLVFLA
jgi:hypothetical protein